MFYEADLFWVKRCQAFLRTIPEKADELQVELSETRERLMSGNAQFTSTQCYPEIVRNELKRARGAFSNPRVYYCG